MKILKTILFGVLSLVIVLAIGGLLLPSSVHVERSTVINASPAAVFDVVNSFKRFNEWSPWYELDPGAQYLYSGPSQGVGARFEWSSKKPEVGSGSQQVIESEPFRRVRTQLDFGSQGTAHGEFTITPAAAGSQVTWAFDAEFGYDLLQRYFGLLYDRWIGADYEKGLAKLKALVEQAGTQPAAAPTMQISMAEVEPMEVVAIEGTASLEPDAISTALDSAYGRIGEFMRANGLEQSAAPLAITRFYDESGWGFEAAIPYKASDAARTRAEGAANGGQIKLARTYAGRVVKGMHVGPHENLPDAYRQLEDYMAANRLEPNGPSWEQYLSTKADTSREPLRTEVFMPVKPQG
ncbi:MAG TPA: SRPBCC family protein [Steroidobacteraceae bacterium]|nr:SRPBCC family protein [Steroidobacteraceae bacterium]